MREKKKAGVRAQLCNAQIPVTSRPGTLEVQGTQYLVCRAGAMDRVFVRGPKAERLQGFKVLESGTMVAVSSFSLFLGLFDFPRRWLISEDIISGLNCPSK